MRIKYRHQEFWVRDSACALQLTLKSHARDDGCLCVAWLQIDVPAACTGQQVRARCSQFFGVPLQHVKLLGSIAKCVSPPATRRVVRPCCMHQARRHTIPTPLGARRGRRLTDEEIASSAASDARMMLFGTPNTATVRGSSAWPRPN